MIIYGTDLCPDCVNCKKDLDRAGVQYEYRNISENLMWLKEFLEFRDETELFAEVKANGWIGIPCIVAEDGTVSLSWEQFM